MLASQDTINRHSFLRIITITLLIVVVSEFIGVSKLTLSKTTISFLPMLYAVIIGVVITPDILGKRVKWLGEFISKKEISMTGNIVMIALLPLGVKYGTLVGPNIKEVINAGPALILQEIGNLASVFIAIPVALLLG
ncbi:DUF3100 domain-containing protein, partial [Hafnia paralvei]|uniref:DUF3100 domain-containing protein n=2 Tax=Hafniaceae TaxID=1903412 RepID=UPI00300C9B3E